MNNAKHSTPRRKAPATVRCAIYTRKSAEEGLEQDFNSLDAQREAGQAYIASQRHAGWSCLPDRYDDGGYSGANIDRPALGQLLAAIAEGKIDCVVVYKVDRLSRSLLDFARLMETFERHGVSFVSVTQQFNTATSMGRLVLNVLLSFAQFEREMIAERTRDKIAATRRKGKWSGGIPRLGYDVQNGKLVINEAESQRVREIFALYLEQPSLTLTVRELSRRGWTTKGWITRKGHARGGRSFTKNGLGSLLRNVVYLGQVRYKDEVHVGEHQAIVDLETFRQVQVALQRNAHRRGGNRNDLALLRGLLHCAACDCPMVYRYAVKRQRRYPYYVCRRATQRGWSTCPAPSLPCGDVERLVVEQILRRGMGDSSSSEQAWSRLLAQWESLAGPDRLAIVDRSVERILYDGQQERISITFRRDQALVDPPEKKETSSQSPTQIVHIRFRRRQRQLRRGAPPPTLPTGRIPRLARLLALAIRLEQLLEERVVPSQAELARLGHVTRARLTQITSLRQLAPDIQEEILFLPLTGQGREILTERQVRPLLRMLSWREQRGAWGRLKGLAPRNKPQ